MKNLFLKSLIVIGLASTLVACSEDEVAAPAPSIVGKWQASSEITRVTLGASILQNDTANYPANFASLDFASSNFVYANVGGMLDTLTYTYANGKLTMIERDPINGNDTTIYNKVTLSTSALVLTELDTTNTGGGLLISEYTINLKK